MKKITLFPLLIFFVTALNAQMGGLPQVYSNISADGNGRLYVKDTLNKRNYYLYEAKPTYTLVQATGNPRADGTGIAFYFGSGFSGTLYDGLIQYEGNAYPQPVYYKDPEPIRNGEAHIDIKGKLKGKYDATGWEQIGQGTLGYRVLNEKGQVVYDGIVAFTGKGPFKIATAITEGPFVNLLSHTGATISFETNMDVIGKVEVGGKTFSDTKPTKNHQVEIKGLKPDSNYTYTVTAGEAKQSYNFSTAPLPGSRKPFIFSFSSGSFSGAGGGEHNVYGTNQYMLKRAMAMNGHKGVAFSQFSGDLVDGYLMDKGEMNLQYANWKRAVSAFSPYFPIYTGMGGHETLMTRFKEGKDSSEWGITVDRFPFAKESAEAVFAENFVNPENGPESEDGAAYDPNPKSTDFPSYSENAYYYTYDNVAMVVMNSDYWYAASNVLIPVSGGNLHGYIMDKQLEWLDKTLQKLESDSTVDHIFVSLHVPLLPNGGHVKDDMWCNGDNTKRAFVKGVPVDKGIIQRRDQVLHTLINKSKKTVAVLTGDEHNYCKTEIGPKTPKYPDGWELNRQELARSIYQINNGAGGAPYYAQENAPWSGYTTGFSTQNAVVYFFVDGRNIEVQVVNPDTMAEIESFILR